MVHGECMARRCRRRAARNIMCSDPRRTTPNLRRPDQNCLVHRRLEPHRFRTSRTTSESILIPGTRPTDGTSDVPNAGQSREASAEPGISPRCTRSPHQRSSRLSGAVGAARPVRRDSHGARPGRRPSPAARDVAFSPRRQPHGRPRRRPRTRGTPPPMPRPDRWRPRIGPIARRDRRRRPPPGRRR
jgi:hypothetical protein